MLHEWDAIELKFAHLLEIKSTTVEKSNLQNIYRKLFQIVNGNLFFKMINFIYF